MDFVWGKQIQHVDRQNGYTTHWMIGVAPPWRSKQACMMLRLRHVKDKGGTVTIRFEDPIQMAEHFERLAAAAREAAKAFEDL